MENKDVYYFHHHHALIPLKLDEGKQIICKACERFVVEPFHGCLDCKYYLHDLCIQCPRSIQHPTHPSHSLSLHPTPTYAGSSYTCPVCNSYGYGFSYICAHCQFDLHVPCASLSTGILIDKHPHEMKLIFNFSYGNDQLIFVCDVGSKKLDLNNNWVYYCRACHFGTHLDCALGCGKVPAGGAAATSPAVSGSSNYEAFKTPGGNCWVPVKPFQP